MNACAQPRVMSGCSQHHLERPLTRLFLSPLNGICQARLKGPHAQQGANNAIGQSRACDSSLRSKAASAPQVPGAAARLAELGCLAGLGWAGPAELGWAGLDLLPVQPAI